MHALSRHAEDPDETQDSRTRDGPARSRRALAYGVALLLFAGYGQGALAQAPVPSTTTGEWPTYGGDLASSKYSPLAQIDRSN